MCLEEVESGCALGDSKRVEGTLLFQFPCMLSCYFALGLAHGDASRKCSGRRATASFPVGTWIGWFAGLTGTVPAYAVSILSQASDEYFSFVSAPRNRLSLMIAATPVDDDPM